MATISLKTSVPRLLHHRAAQELVEFGQPAITVLVEALGHKKATVRLEAAMALGMIGKGAKPAVTPQFIRVKRVEKGPH